MADANSETQRFLEKELDRQERDIAALENEVRDVPGLRKEVGMLRESVRSNTNAVYTLVAVIIGTGLLGALLKAGVI
jgi:hypothetical protein